MIRINRCPLLTMAVLTVVTFSATILGLVTAPADHDLALQAALAQTESASSFAYTATITVSGPHLAPRSAGSTQSHTLIGIWQTPDRLQLVIGPPLPQIRWIIGRT